MLIAHLSGRNAIQFDHCLNVEVFILISPKKIKIIHKNSKSTPKNTTIFFMDDFEFIFVENFVFSSNEREFFATDFNMIHFIISNISHTSTLL